MIGLLAELVAGVAGAIALTVDDVPVEPLANGVPRVAATVPLTPILAQLFRPQFHANS